MALMTLVKILIVLGILLWLVNQYIPMQSSIKPILNIVVVVAVCIWLLQATGLWSGVSQFQIGR